MKIIIAIIAVIVIVCGGAFAMTNTNGNAQTSIDAGGLEDIGNLCVNASEDSKEKVLITSYESDLNSLLVTNNGKLTLKDSIINKTGDTQTSGDDADFYGVNSADYFMRMNISYSIYNLFH